MRNNTGRGVMKIRRNSHGAAGASGLPARRTRMVAMLAVLGVLASGAIVTTPYDPAYAAEWPTWSDVADARRSEQATKAKIQEITALLAGLRSEVERTAADAEAKGLLWEEADLKFQEAAFRAAELQKQADAAQVIADDSEQRAGQMAAQLARSGNKDITANLFVNAGKADGLLYGLGMASKISEQAQALYSKAIQDRNSAQAQTDLANVAKTLLEELKLLAEKAFNDAQTASNAAAAALATQEEHQAELQQQLIVLTEDRVATEADYLAGVRERIGTGASLDAGEISLSGWARPVSGRITSPYGYRSHPVSGGWRLHTGTDIGAACSRNIYAASSGTVTYAGRNGTYGNWVAIDHGNGVSTGYAHIINGGILVSYGQEVVVGQAIAKIGTTGSSTGCHLHFEVRINGVATDAVPFMRNQGITIG